MGVVRDIVLDSFIVNLVTKDEINSLTIEDLYELAPYVKNFDKVLQIYEGNYSFSNEDLIVLLEDLNYLGSNKVKDVLVLMKIRETEQKFNFISHINKYLSNDYNIIKYFKSLLLTAIKYNIYNLVLFVLNNSSKFEIDDGLVLASENGYLEIVKLLLKNGANVHAENDYALIWASRNGHFEVVKLLLKNGPKVHVKDNSLVWASSEGHFEVVKLLLKNGANVHTENDYALI